MQPQHVCQFSSTACSSMLFPTQLALLLALPLCECFGVPPQATVVDEVMFDNVSDLSAGSDASQRTQRSAGTYYRVHSGQYCAQRGSKRPSTCGYQTKSGGYCAGRTGKTRRPWASYTGAHRNQSASRHATQLRIATRSTGVHITAIARLSSAATRALQQHPIRSGTPIGQRRARSRVRHAKMRATRRVSARPLIGVPTTTIVF